MITKRLALDFDNIRKGRKPINYTKLHFDQESKLLNLLSVKC